ncbi:MAG: hypothetical protein EZS28_049175 [Streblomastix strix]|uniref:Uncharacterized protein n=1 Tax=Streblomastix strix TaxID=222440 RepID=A0A5J4TAL2_9EUKA|nr:MAG: hypothetical protein EZS28_049175 [Streblomastix strix]
MNSRQFLWLIQYNGDASDQAELVNIKYVKVLIISFSSAGGIGKQDKEIFQGLSYISDFLRQLHEGRNYPTSFQPLPLLAHRSEEQMEEEGGSDELEAQLINKGIYIGNSIKYWVNLAKTATLKHFMHGR